MSELQGGGRSKLWSGLLQATRSRVHATVMYACDELLSNGSEGYNIDEGSYDPTRDFFHVDHGSPDEGNQLGMPREDDETPPRI